MEWIITGYCRAQDQPRMVMLEEEGGQWDCDCDFPGCAFAESCLLAQQMREKQQQ